MATKAEWGVTQPQAKGRRRPPGAEEVGTGSENLWKAGSLDDGLMGAQGC